MSTSSNPKYETLHQYESKCQKHNNTITIIPSYGQSGGKVKVSHGIVASYATLKNAYPNYPGNCIYGDAETCRKQ